jgi:hypothetical protein
LVYGNPLGRVASQTTSGSQDTSTLQNVLGLAAVGGGLYKNLGGQQGISNLWNSGANWLSGSGGFGTGAAYGNQDLGSFLMGGG